MTAHPSSRQDVTGSETAIKRVLIAGGSGFVGRMLGMALARQGVELNLLSRNPQKLAGCLPFPCRLFQWNSDQPVPDEALVGCQAIINLVGEGIADRPWTTARRAALRNSRVFAAQNLAKAALLHTHSIRVLLQASAIGYYGDHGEKAVSEGDAPGQGFLADICQEWESPLTAPAEAGIRSVALRFGLILGDEGGALPKLREIYAAGAGAILGSGQQWQSWVHIKDVIDLAMTALNDSRFQGPINVTAPEPCRFSALHAALARHSPSLVPMKVPAAFLRTVMGARSELVLSSQRVLPMAAQRFGFTFNFPTIEQAFADLDAGSVAKRTLRLVTHQWLDRPLPEVFAFFCDERNLEAITPDWLHFEVKDKSTPSIQQGTRIRYKLRLHGVPVQWESAITQWDTNHSFTDEQLKGPYAIWHHRHLFEPLANGTLISDVVQYRLPVFPFGPIVAGTFVARDVQRIFHHRQQAIATWAQKR